MPDASAPRNAIKVCMIGDASSPHVYTWSCAMSGAGLDTVMLSPRPRERSALPLTVVPPARFGPRPLRQVVNLCRWARALRAIDADIFHAHYAADYGPWALGLFKAGPFALTAMGSDVFLAAAGRFGRLQRWLTRRALSRTRLLVTHSRHAADAAIAGGTDPAAVHLSLWGVDLDRFAPDPEARAAMRETWGVSQDDFVVLSPRGLGAIYDQSAIVDGIGAAGKSRSPVVLVLPAGDRSDPAARALVERAKHKHVDLRLVDQVEHAKMPAAYSAADAVISMAKSDNVPRTIIESMACGTPVIARSSPDLAGTVEDRRQALLVDGRPDAIGAAVAALAADRDLASRLRTEGRRFVEANADLFRDTRAIAGKYAEILRERSA